MCAEENPEDNIACSFCGKLTKDVESMIAAQGDLAICNECVQLCLAILEGKGVDKSRLAYLPGEKSRVSKENLRPISKLPEGWKIKSTELFATDPYLTAQSPTGRSHADFALPKQLAWWMLSDDKRFDFDELKEEAIKHVSYVVMQTLMKY